MSRRLYIFKRMGELEVDASPDDEDYIAKEMAALDKHQTDQIGDYVLWDPESPGMDSASLYLIDGEGPHLK